MNRKNKILIGVDGSKNSLRAVEVAADIAKSRGSKVDLVYAVGPTELAGKESAGGGGVHLGEIEFNPAKEILDRMGVENGTVLEFEHPAEAILKLAENYDMVVMGRRGMGPIKGIVMGSVSMKVSQECKVPVLLVP